MSWLVNSSDDDDDDDIGIRNLALRNTKILTNYVKGKVVLVLN
jgi:hypothetical protein